MDTLSSDPEAPLLEARDVARRDPRSAEEQWLLRDVSVAVSSSDRLALSGPSGAGKSLLLRTLCLLEPVNRGSVRFQGAVVQGSAVPAFRSRVQYIHQRPVFRRGTVRSNLELPFRLRANERRGPFDLERALRWFAVLGRDGPFLDKHCDELSGGEAQIAALVRALQLDPVVLLLDEPTASLDAETGRAIEQLVDSWLQETSERRDRPAPAAVWVSHDAEQNRRVADRALRLRSGEIEAP